MTSYAPKIAADVVEIISESYSNSTALQVVGRETKLNFANACMVEQKLSLAGLNGINFYEPSELAISVLAGTPLSVVEAELAKTNQRFAFEPPRLNRILGGGDDPSIGGLVATNLSGPARVNRGALRDHLLGVEFVNGKGEAVKSGGRVMKNVTGYDLCKMMAGSWGTLGVLTNVVLKTLPKMETETTLLIGCDTTEQAGALMRQAMGTPFDVISTAYLPNGVDGLTTGVAAIRVEGLEQSVSYRISELEDLLEGNQKEQLQGQDSIDFWHDVQEVSKHLKNQDQVWKISVAPTDGPAILDKLTLDETRSGFLDWSGGLIWLGTNDADTSVRDELDPWLKKTTGGHATLVQGSAEILRDVLPSKQHALMQQIKGAFDPKGILSPNRFV